jgi:hypothetical protein
MNEKSTTDRQSEIRRTEEDDGYPILEDLIRQQVRELKHPLFTTDVEDLYAYFLDHLPSHKRQHYTCHNCKHFVNRYGTLVTIDEHGFQRSAVISSTQIAEQLPDLFVPSFVSMVTQLGKAKVTGVFLTSRSTWGTPVTGAWTHMAGQPPPSLLYQGQTKTENQMMAEKKEDFRILHAALCDVRVETVNQAVRVLEADALDRSEKTLGVAQWFQKLQNGLFNIRGPRRDNIIWRAVATAPAGWCHLRNSMIGTLLKDIEDGLDFDAIKRRWAEKMHPLQYQRPSSISDGAIERAEKIVSTLRTAGALERRFARREDVTYRIWERAPEKPQKTDGGVFSHLRKPESNPGKLMLPTVKRTWAKFLAEIIPFAERIQLMVPYGQQPYYGLVTAANPEAPAILQWDGLPDLPRNPVSWYVYNNGSPAAAWGLTAGHLVDVPAICRTPNKWQRPDQFDHQGDGIMFLLDGARDVGITTGGGFFPEILKSEYHEIRHVMEQYAKQARIAGKEEGDANGLLLQKNYDGGGYSFRVTLKDEDTRVVILDRWD